MDYHIVEARYVAGHIVWLRFRDGTSGEIDLCRLSAAPSSNRCAILLYSGSSRFILSFTPSSGRMAPTCAGVFARSCARCGVTWEGNRHGSPTA